MEREGTLGTGLQNAHAQEWTEEGGSASVYWKWPESGRSVRKSRGGFPEVVNGQSGPYWSGAKWNPSCVWKDN